MSRSEHYPQDRDEQLEQALKILDEVSDAYEKAELLFADLDVDYELAFSSAFNAARAPSAQAKEQIAKEATIVIRRQHRKAKAQLSILKAKVRSAQNAVSGRQSLLNSSRRTNEAFG